MTTEEAKSIRKKPEEPSSVFKAGTLSEIFEHLNAQESPSLQCTLIDAFLHTYRIFSTTEQVLLTADRLFWDVCHSEIISVETKLRAINSLRLLLSRWLRQPHVRDFDSPIGLAELHRFTCIVVGWYWAFQDCPATNNEELPGSWTSRYIDKSSNATAGTASSIIFSTIDKHSRRRMAYKLDYLCKHADYRAKVLQTKHGGLDPNANSVRPSHRQHSPYSDSFQSYLDSCGHVRKSSAPPEGRAEQFPSGLERFNVAEELTVIDQGLFLSLLLPELLNHVRNRPCPTYMATVNQFNRVVNLVQCSILGIGPGALKDPSSEYCSFPTTREANAPLAVAVWSNRHLISQPGNQSRGNAMDTFCETEHKRAKIIAQWIDVAWRLRQLNNLNSLQAILIALQIGPIHRLRHCWTIVELLHADHFRRFEMLNALMDIAGNHEKVRDYMRKHLELLMRSEQARRGTHDNSNQKNLRKPPKMIPYLGIFMSDLTFLNSAHPDYVSPPAVPTLRLPGTTKSPRRPSPVFSSISCSSSGHSSASSNWTGSLSRSRERGQTSSSSLGNRSESHISQVSHKSRSCSRSRDKSSPGDVKLINFQKHIREANTLRDIYLLQHSASFYNLKSDPRFRIWFEQFPKLSESEAMNYSYLIEPKENMSTVSSIPGAFDRRKNKKPGSTVQTSSSPQISFTPGSSPLIGPRRTRSGSQTMLPRYKIPNQTRRPSHDKPAYDTVPSPADSPYHSSSGVDSPNSPPSPNSIDSQKTGLKCRAQNSNWLEAPTVSRGRSPSSQSSACRDRRSPEASDLTVHVTVQDPELASKQSIDHDGQAFLKYVAKLGSTPNLATAGKIPQSPFDSPSVYEKVLSTDSIADLVARVVTKLGLPSVNLAQYDLVAVQDGAPDHILPMDTNAFRTLSRVQLKGSAVANVINPRKAIKCSLVRHLPKSVSLNFNKLRPMKVRTMQSTFTSNRLRSQPHRQPLGNIIDHWRTAQMLS